MRREDFNPIPCSVKEIPLETLKSLAYPNPAKNELNIRTTLQNAVAEVYSLQGQLMCSQPLNDIITSFNTDSWSSGTYLWRVIKDGQVCEHGKWVKM